MNTLRVETWSRGGKSVAKIVVRNENGQFHGATNFRQLARVGQIAKSRRQDAPRLRVRKNA